ncbi:hypothetical protein PH189_11235 [Actinomycetospora chibensis]|uniref:hypothetical protein n=1 Tax=Actinomycetospora chibensis TaxID=663606 RepID=UPI002366FEA8|nr:hypothetical protein [Actinomycetospora chibensis]MDD7924139.1 hypothetical protein [Actinomycetospora chibensis]
MLEASPDGLSDAALAQALGDGTRPQTVNQLCRRLVAEGALVRVGTRPILNRLPTPPARRRGRKTTATPGAPDSTPEAPPTELRARRTGSRRAGTATPPKSGRESADLTTPTPDASETEATPATESARRAQKASRAKSGRVTADVTTPPPDASETEASPASEATPEPQDTPASSAKPKRRKQSAAESAAPAPDPIQAPEHAEPTPGVDTPATSQTEADAPTCGPPPFDALQAWSRVANVQALVADWLVRRGATLRSATLDGQGPTRDLVASLDGDDVHVEVTGWPADGARTHPTTIAGDWFAGAEQAAAQRRRAHPRARIVIALPDTRRYRSLTEQRATSLAGANAEVWFVDPAGSVQAR